MADVTRDRAQLVLVAALVLAATLVGVALVLNGVIFTENLATRETNDDVDATQEYQQQTRVSIAEALGDVNTNPNNDTHAELRTNLSAAVENRTTIIQHDAAISGGSVDVDVRSTTGGFLMKQTNASRNFTAGGAIHGQRNWSLVTGASPNTELRQNISRESLYEATADTTWTVMRQKAYHVQIDNGSITWDVYLFQGAITGNIYVLTDRSDWSPDGKVVNYFNQTCSRQSRYAEVDFHEGTVDGTDCGALAFYPNLSDDVDVSHNNTVLTVNGNPDPQVRGTYELRANNSSVQTDAFHNVSDGRSPFKVTALTTGEVVLTHRTSNLTYESTAGVPAPTLGRVQPGENAPVITDFDVVDYTDGVEKYDFEVSFDAEDADGNLDTAEFIVTDDEGRGIENETVDLSGSADSVTRRFTKTNLLSMFENDGNFTLQVYVYDATNRSADAGDTHEADGDDTGSPYPSYGSAVDLPPADRGGDVGDLGRATPTPTGDTEVSLDDDVIDDEPTVTDATNTTDVTEPTDTSTEGGP